MARGFYFLDRNAVARIKEFNEGKIDKKDKTKMDFLEYLKSLDVSGNAVAASFSIMEGSSEGNGTPIARQVNIIDETRALSLFYKNARTDSEILNRNKEQNSESLSIEEQIATYKPRRRFIESAHKLLNVKPEDDKDSIVGELITIAKSSGLSPSDPIVFICTACVYGSQVAYSIAKPNKPVSAHNFLGDFYAVQTLAYIKGLSAMYFPGSKNNFHFVTMDKGLSNLMDLIEIKLLDVKNNSFGEGLNKFEITFSRKLFPSKISQKKINEISERLKNS